MTYRSNVSGPCHCPQCLNALRLGVLGPTIGGIHDGPSESLNNFLILRPSKRKFAVTHQKTIELKNVVFPCSSWAMLARFPSQTWRTCHLSIDINNSDIKNHDLLAETQTEIARFNSQWFWQWERGILWSHKTTFLQQRRRASNKATKNLKVVLTHVMPFSLLMTQILANGTLFRRSPCLNIRFMRPKRPHH